MAAGRIAATASAVMAAVMAAVTAARQQWPPFP